MATMLRLLKRLTPYNEILLMAFHSPWYCLECRPPRWHPEHRRQGKSSCHLKDLSSGKCAASGRGTNGSYQREPGSTVTWHGDRRVRPPTQTHRGWGRGWNHLQHTTLAINPISQNFRVLSSVISFQKKKEKKKNPLIDQHCQLQTNHNQLFLLSEKPTRLKFYPWRSKP